MINSLRLQDYRSYKDESFEFDPGVNIIVGPNASGKTNLLEALLVIARGTSFRAKDSELVAFKRPWARLDASNEQNLNRTVKIVLEPLPKKTYELEGKTYQRLSLQHSLPVVLFEPNHLQLLTGSPQQRRDYLDDLLEQTTPGYKTLRQQYRRTLAQRNALLKQHHAQLSTQIFPWDIRLSELAATIVRARQELVGMLAGQVGALYKNLAHAKTKVQLEYQSQFAPDQYESHLLHKLEVSQDLDVQRGFTGSGPHRDDLLVIFNGHLASEAASRGETRTAVLALKIMELTLLHEVRGTPPLLLLDDVFSELDGARRRALTAYLKDYQTFITTTDADVVVQNFTETCHILPLGS